MNAIHTNTKETMEQVQESNTIMLIEPAHLRFRAPFFQPLVVEMTLTNPSEKLVHFRVRTRFPTKFHMRPTFGRLDPHESTKVDVFLHKCDENDFNERDKVIVECFEIDDDGVFNQLWTREPLGKKIHAVLDVIVGVPGEEFMGIEIPCIAYMASPQDSIYQYDPFPQAKGQVAVTVFPPKPNMSYEINWLIADLVMRIMNMDDELTPEEKQMWSDLCFTRCAGMNVDQRVQLIKNEMHLVTSDTCKEILVYIKAMQESALNYDNVNNCIKPVAEQSESEAEKEAAIEVVVQHIQHTDKVFSK